MNTNNIEKLMEIKKLYEAGILTKEEMEAEKNKVLHTENVINEELLSEEIATDATPVMTDSEGRFVFDTSAETKPAQAPQSLKQGEVEISTKWLWIIGGGIVAFVITLFTLSDCNGKVVDSTYEETETVNNYEETEAAIDSVYNADDCYDTSIDEEFSMEATVPDISYIWEGDFTITGGIYRSCQSMALLSLSHEGDDSYSGTIHLMLGWEDDMGRFDFFYGELIGSVHAMATNGMIAVYLEDFNIEAGYEGDFISPEGLQRGMKIFQINYINGGYTVVPTSKMKSFFDGVSDDNMIVKR